MEKIRLDISSESIQKQIEATLMEMASIYTLDKQIPRLKGYPIRGWADSESGKGLIIAAEALECFFIPYYHLKGFQEFFWSDKLDRSIITESIGYLIEGYKKEDQNNDGILGLSGTPYLNFKLIGDTDDPSGIERNFDFIDTACFVICALLDAKFIERHRQYLAAQRGFKESVPASLYPADFEEKIDSRLIDCFKLLGECDLGEAGYTFTNDPIEEREGRVDFIYFTWNAVEVIDAVSNLYDLLPELIREDYIRLMAQEKDKRPLNITTTLLEKKVQKRTFFASNYLQPIDKRDLYFGDKILTLDGVPNPYYNNFLLLTFLQCDSREEEHLSKALSHLINQFSKVPYQTYTETKHSFQLDGPTFPMHQKTWGERAFLPQILKCVCIFGKKFYKDALDKLVSRIPKEGMGAEKPYYDTSDSLLNYYCDLLNRRKCVIDNVELDKGRKFSFSNIWDRSASRVAYSIYYTQRVIEALAHLHSLLYPEKVPTFLPSPLEKEVKIEGISRGIVINITGDVISEKIADNVIDLLSKKPFEDKMIESIIENRMSKIVAKHLEEGMSKIDEKIRDGIDEYLIRLFGNIQLSKREEDILEHIIIRIIELFSNKIEIFIAQSLIAKDPKMEEKLQKGKFTGRIREAFQYWLKHECEISEINYSLLLSDIFNKYAYKKK